MQNEKVTRPPGSRRNKGLSLMVILLLLMVLFIADLAIGSVYIPIADIFSSLLGMDQSDSVFHNIVWQFRMTKALTCIVAGGSLATGGLLMQTLFRNPLAGPDVLGLSAGASLMVALLLLVGSSGNVILPYPGSWTLALAASAGSAAVFVLVMGVANRVKDNTSLLIIGLMIGAATASFVSVLQFMSHADELQVFMIWTMGNVGSTDWTEIMVLFVVLLMGTGLSLVSVKSINAWLLGDNYAQSLGVNLKKSRLIVLLATSVMTGGVTAFCGPIAFVGLAVPHLVRLLLPTTDHRMLIPMVVLGGASLLLLCDVIAQLPGSSQVLPLNAVTSIIGAPVVIWVVVRSKKINI
jgi:iron complex transport system permease protein